MKKFSYYQYRVFESTGKDWSGWVYEIYSQDKVPELIRESDEWFDSQTQAGLAAIGHISLLENGEG
tara:strand:- start:1528 stop:1725 length:198 start_codon:yes stop_codon:yes gene_type:complete